MKPDTCGCCELPVTTPLVAQNRPGLSAIVFRVGTYGTFRFSMLQRIAGQPALSALQTRDDDDYAISVLDLWAAVADVLTFYQERIANEGYLRTARFRDSVLRLARLLDYQLWPGLAATTLLAFTLDKDASLEIAKGLRVQSVPADDERPQVFETLESIQADSRLNRLSVLPPPEAFNPLVRGNTSAILAPGSLSLAAAAGLAPGNRLLLFELSPPGALEELVVRDLRVEGDREILAWTVGIQGTTWGVDSPLYAFGRTFRIFGYNTPSTYMEPTESPAGSHHFIWTQRSIDYGLAGNRIPLDSKYEAIVPGTRLVISWPGSNELFTVTSVTQDQATLANTAGSPAPFQDTVTFVTLDGSTNIPDRRQVVIYELKSPRLRFWGYRYGGRVDGDTVFVPARRIDATTAEIGRGIQKGAYTSGVSLDLKSMQPGRKVLLLDSAQTVTAAVVTEATIEGLEPQVTTTVDDLTTAVELRLDSTASQPTIALRSPELPSAITLTTGQPELAVTIGTLEPRVIQLSSAPTNPASAATLLQAALQASLSPAPEFANSQVLELNGSLLVLPGVPGAAISFAPTLADLTTVGELGLVAPYAYPVNALFSGSLSTFPAALSNPLREMRVKFGPVGPRRVALSAAPISLAAAATQIEQAIAAGDKAPAFAGVTVQVVGSRLLIVPGSAGSPMQEYLAVKVQPEVPFDLATDSAVLLGNVAQSSHGEKVRDEVLGDGDAAAVFQSFDLQKKPLTYIPSADAGGRESTLEILVNGVLWSEVDSLFGRRTSDQVYTTRLADDGTVTVRFGDGQTGARLPSGRGNVVAEYHHGSGLAGRVGAGSLKNPLDLPVGLKSVSNPSAATGGADPESLEEARENAPSTVRTFGRAVSLEDFEDLVRTNGEVAKALATWVWNGESRAIHLTVAAQQGQLFSPADLARIHSSLNTQRDPNHALFLDNYRQVPVVVSATVRIKAARVAKQVGDACRSALSEALSFDNLPFGQPLALSQMVRVLQEVAGVDSVDIDLFQFKDQTPAFLSSRGATADPVQRSLRIFAAQPNPVPPPLVLAAELAVVEDVARDLMIITSGGLPS